ncbi:MAG: restriction endonuclease subunit S [Rudaea sp.]
MTGTNAPVPAIDIRPDHWQIVRHILRSRVPQYAVWAFGSRAKWTAKPHSDLDLAVITKKNLPLSVSAALTDDFSESNLPWKVDVVDWAATSESFRKVIERDRVVVQTAGLPSPTRLSDVAFINPPRKVEKGALVPFIEMAALPLSGRDIAVADVETRIAKAAGAHFQNGDTLLARITPCLENGKTAQVRVLAHGEIGEGSTEFIVLCGQEPADNNFIYYLCRDPEFREYAIARMEGTSGRQRVAWQSIAEYQIDLPPPGVRRDAADFLATLDDRIDNLRQTNATLEAIGAALFKSWFVDFDGVPPEKMQESELGLIPKGWRIGTVGDIATVSSGKRPESRFAELTEEASVELWGGNGPIAYTTKSLTDERILLTGRVGTLGSVFRISQPCWPSDNTLFLQEKIKLTFDYLFFRLRQMDFATLNRGSTQPLLTQTDLKSQRVVLPPGHFLSQFDEVVAPLFQRIEQNSQQAATLAALRDTLLPRLISGRLRVGEVERITAEIA